MREEDEGDRSEALIDGGVLVLKNEGGETGIGGKRREIKASYD